MGCCCCCCCCCCCFNKLNAKTLEIIMIVFHSVDTALILISTCVMHWKYFPIYIPILYIITLLISIALLVFIILLRYWRAANIIKNRMYKTANLIGTIGFSLIIFFFAFCIIEEFIIVYFGFYGYEFYNSCYSSECDLDILMFYLTFSALEITLMLGMYIWYVLRERIELKIDGPVEHGNNNYAGKRQTTGTSRKMMGEPCKKKLIVNQLNNIVSIENKNYLELSDW